MVHNSILFSLTTFPTPFPRMQFDTNGSITESQCFKMLKRFVIRVDYPPFSFQNFPDIHSSKKG